MSIKALLKRIVLETLLDPSSAGRTQPEPGEVIFSGTIGDMALTIEFVRFNKYNIYLLSIVDDGGFDVEDQQSVDVEFMISGLNVLINDQQSDRAVAVYEKLATITL